MRILIVSNYYYPEHAGGVETVSFNLVKHYREFSHKVRWMAADVHPSLRAADEDDVPISAWNLTEEKLGFPHPLPHPNVGIKLWRSIKWCDVLHLQDCLYPINIFAFLIAKLLKKPILITQYAKFIPYGQFYKRFLQSIAYRTVGSVMFRFSDKIVFITSNVRDAMRYLAPNRKLDVVPLGVDTDFYHPISDSERDALRHKITGDSSAPLILFVGRMVERKGIHLIKPIIGTHKEWNWVLVGRPDDFNPHDWQTSNLTYFQNASDLQLKELYSSADLLVHPSMGEGITLIVSESLASGTPVVISRESLYEVDESDRPLFFAVQPESDDIERSLVRALADRPHLEALRTACREYALNRLSWKKMAKQYLLILDEIAVTKQQQSV